MEEVFVGARQYQRGPKPQKVRPPVPRPAEPEPKLWMPSRSGRPLHELTNLTPVPPPHPLRRRYSAASPMGRGPGVEVECARPRKICAKREDFWDATGARTFLSAATPEYSTGSERSKALLPFDVAADKNVRAPLFLRLCRPEGRRHLPRRTWTVFMAQFSFTFMFRITTCA